MKRVIEKNVILLAKCERNIGERMEQRNSCVVK